MTLGPEYVETMKIALSEFLDRSGSFAHEYKTQPLAESKAAEEMQRFARPESITTVSAYSHTLLEYGAEHLSLFLKTLRPPVEMIACWTSVRSMLESCSVAAWILDPSIDVHERVGRAYSYRYEGLMQQLRFGKAIKRPAAEIKAEEDRIDKLEQTILGLGYQRVINRHGERIGFCQHAPSATEIIEAVLGEGIIYRLLSAVAHGHHWALTKLCFKPTGNEVDLGEGVKAMGYEKTDDLQGIALLGHCGFNALARPLWNMSHYYGWNTLKLEEILEDTADKIDQKDAGRFWRS